MVEVCLNRPERHNGLDQRTARALLDAVVAASQAPDVRCILLTGEGPSFCSGDDVATLGDFLSGERTTAPADAGTGDAYYIRICEELLLAPKPVVVALQGHVMGAGLEIACAADVRIAATDVRIACPLAGLGHVGPTAMLQRVVGVARATSFYMLQQTLVADDAKRLGVVDRVVEPERLRSLALEMAQELAAGPTRSFALFKDLRERQAAASAMEALRIQDRYHELCRSTVLDAAEGPTAFLERRTPQFVGR